MLTPTAIEKHKQAIVGNEQFQSQAALAKCLADPTCLKVLYVLSKSDYVCPSDFSEILALSLPTISHQLAKLRQMGIVQTVRHGQMMCYSLSETEESKLVKATIKVLLKG